METFRKAQGYFQAPICSEEVGGNWENLGGS